MDTGTIALIATLVGAVLAALGLLATWFWRQRGSSARQVEVHRFPTKVGKPTVYLGAGRNIRFRIPFSFILLTHRPEVKIIGVKLRWEHTALLGQRRLLKEFALVSVNEEQRTAWDYSLDVPEAGESPMQDLVFEESWREPTESNLPRRSQLVIALRLVGAPVWERVGGKLIVNWRSPGIGEIGYEATDEMPYSGGRTWVDQKGGMDKHIWNA